MARHAAVIKALPAAMPPEPVRGLPPLSCRKHAGIADMVDDPACVVEPKNKSERQPRSIGHIASNHTIDRPRATHLDHLALASPVGKIASLSNEALDAASIR